MCFATADFFLEEALTVSFGMGAFLVTGDRRKAVGEGIAIVAIELMKLIKLSIRILFS